MHSDYSSAHFAKIVVYVPEIFATLWESIPWIQPMVTVLELPHGHLSFTCYPKSSAHFHS